MSSAPPRAFATITTGKIVNMDWIALTLGLCTQIGARRARAQEPGYCILKMTKELRLNQAVTAQAY